MARRKKVKKERIDRNQDPLSRTVAEKMNWSVFFIYKGVINRKRFGGELTEAVDLVGKLEIKKEKGVKVSNITLYCDNYGFPPPEKIAKKIQALNDRSIFWCPHCMKLRKFELSGPFTGEYEHDYTGYYCVVCEVSHRSWDVRRYNPGLREKPQYYD